MLTNESYQRKRCRTTPLQVLEGCKDIAELLEMLDAQTIFLPLLYLSHCPQTPCFIFIGIFFR